MNPQHKRLRQWIVLAILSAASASTLAARPAASAEPIIGMYIHQHWPFNHPYAARTWTIADWRGYLGGLKTLGYNTVQIWPVLETMPQPLTDSDRANIDKIARVVDTAHELKMRVYIMICANIIAKDSMAAQSTFEQRHFFHCDLRVDPADKGAVARMMTIRRNLFEPLAGIDGVTIIDSDPGGYPGSNNEEFIALLAEHRRMLDRLRPGIELIYWLHVSWPAYSEYYKTGNFRWGKLDEYRDALRRLKALNPEPWGFANGLELAGDVGIDERRVINFRYGAIEAEPSYPLTNFGGDAAFKAGGMGAPHGVMGNAQAHCLQLPNTFAFARGARGIAVQRKDYVDFADRLIPGKGELIVKAWETLNGSDASKMTELATGLDELADGELTAGPLGGLLFGDPRRFVEDLAYQLRFAAAYRELSAAVNDKRNIKVPFAGFVTALDAWQKRHGYENYWGFKTWGSWPELMKALDRINDPRINAVLDFDLQAKTPYGRVKEEFYRYETFTAQLIKAFKAVVDDMQP